MIMTFCVFSIIHNYVGVNVHGEGSFIQQFIGNPLLIDGRYVDTLLFVAAHFISSFSPAGSLILVCTQSLPRWIPSGCTRTVERC